MNIGRKASLLKILTNHFFMLRILLKIWPTLLPLALYALWFFLFKKRRKKDYIDGDFKVENEKPAQNKPFSLENRAFVIILYATFLLIIFSLIFTAIRAKPTNYTVEEKKIIVE